MMVVGYGNGSGFVDRRDGSGESQDHLKTAYGVHFRNMGTLQATPDYYYLTLELKLPIVMIKRLRGVNGIGLTCPEHLDPIPCQYVWISSRCSAVFNEKQADTTRN